MKNADLSNSLINGKWLGHSLPMGVLLVLCLLAPSRGFALDPVRSVFQYNCRSWTRQNGLPANGVNAIAQTKDGYLWLGTAMGVARFDGSEFKLLDMGQFRSTVVTSLSSSKQGGLWFGLERGAFGFCDGDTVSLRAKEEWGGMSLNVHSIVETSEADIWIGAETQSARLTKSNTYEAMMTGATAKDRYDVTSVCQDSLGRVWLGTMRRGLYFWRNGVLTKFPDRALDDLIIRSLAEDKQGQIWIGTEKGLLCYDSNFQRKPMPFPWYETRALLADRRGAVWAGTSGGGLMRYLNDVSTTFRKTDGLADDFVTALAEDQEGSLWVGTRDGLSQLSDVKIPTFGKTEGLTADVNVSVCDSQKGGLWVATGEGFTYFDGGAQTYSTNVGLSNVYIKRVFEAKNGDLYLINGAMEIEVVSGGTVVARYPNSTWPMAMAEDDRGVVVAVGGELYRAGTNYYEPYAFTNHQKPALSWAFNLASDPDGSLWIACDNGICQVKGETFQMWTKENGLPNSKVIWVCQDSDSTIWAGMEAGMARLKNGRIRTITRDDGLFDNIIYAIIPDDHGFLWVDSSRGIFRVSRQSLNDFADGKTAKVECVAYDGLNAVKSDEKNQQIQSGCKTRDGRIWFPTAQGVVMIDPTNITANPVPPQVHIQSVHANGCELNKAGQKVVRPGKGELEFHYAGLSYIAPQKTQYRYKLDGYDKNWVEAGTRRSAFYTNLKPGKYQFQVQACNEDGVWNATGSSFGLELLPHFYQTAWFTVLMGVMIIAGVFGSFGWRMRHLRRKQTQLQEAHDLLEAKVGKRTAELAESNTSLKNEIEERKRMELEIERAHNDLMIASRHAGQAEVASSVLHNVGNVLNSVNVSATLISDRLRKLRLANLTKAAQLMQDHAPDLGRFLTADEKGRQLPRYLGELARHLGEEQDGLLHELKGLAHNVEHIKEIVAMQQTYARMSGVLEMVSLVELVEGALRMQGDSFSRHAVEAVRDYEAEAPSVMADKHKVLQILVNVLQNARQACDENGQREKIVSVRIMCGAHNTVNVEVADNGIGIAPENLTRIFAHGFTTRQNGHGFGLHSAALAAKGMGGDLTAHSDGVGRGAKFILQLPLPAPTEELSTYTPESAEPALCGML